MEDKKIEAEDLVNKKTIDCKEMRLTPDQPNPDLNKYIKENKKIVKILNLMNKCKGLKEISDLFESEIQKEMLSYGYSSELYKTTAYYRMTFKKNDKDKATIIRLQIDYDTKYGGVIFNLVPTHIDYKKQLSVQYITESHLLEISNKKTYVSYNLKEGIEFEFFNDKDNKINEYEKLNPNSELKFERGNLAIRKIKNSSDIKVDFVIDYSREKIKIDYVYINEIDSKNLNNIFAINNFIENNFNSFVKNFNGINNNYKELCDIYEIENEINIFNEIEKNNKYFFNVFSIITKENINTKKLTNNKI